MPQLPCTTLICLAGRLAATLVCSGAVACQKDTATPTPATTVSPTTTAGLPFAALPLAATAPTTNLSSQARVDLGRALLWDLVLSGSKDVEGI